MSDENSAAPPPHIRRMRSKYPWLKDSNLSHSQIESLINPKIMGQGDFNPFHHPFTESIMDSTVPPASFSIPGALRLFDGNDDAMQHLTAFHAQSSLYGLSDSAMCKIFPCTLTDQPLNWFYALPACSISSFQELANTFLSAFSLTRKLPVRMNYLKSFAQADDETLGAYMERFNDDALEVGLSAEKYLLFIQDGLADGHFKRSLQESPPETLEEFRRKANSYEDKDEEEYGGELDDYSEEDE